MTATATGVDEQTAAWILAAIDAEVGALLPEISSGVAAAIRAAGTIPIEDRGGIGVRFGSVDTVATDGHADVFLDGDARTTPCTLLGGASEQDRVAVLIIPPAGALVLGSFGKGGGGGPPTGALLGSVDNTVTAETSLVAFGAPPRWQVQAANGTAGSPTATTVAQELGAYRFGGYGATVPLDGLASITGYAAENHSDTAGGSYLVGSTSPAGTTTAIEAWRSTADQSFVVGNIGGNEQANLLNAPRFMQVTTNGTTTITATSGTFTQDDVGKLVWENQSVLNFLRDTRIVSVDTVLNTATLSRAAVSSAGGVLPHIGAFGTPPLLPGSKDTDLTEFKLRTTSAFIGHYVYVPNGGVTDRWVNSTALALSINHFYDDDPTSHQDSIAPGPRAIIQTEGNVRFGPNVPPKDGAALWLNQVLTYQNEINTDSTPGNLIYGVVTSPSVVAVGTTGALTFAQSTGHWSNTSYDSVTAGSVLTIAEVIAYQTADFINASAGTTNIHRYTGFLVAPPSIAGGTVDRAVGVDIGYESKRTLTGLSNSANSAVITSATPMFFPTDVGGRFSINLSGDSHTFIKVYTSSTQVTISEPLSGAHSGVIGSVVLPTRASTLAGSATATVNNGLRNALPTVWTPTTQTIGVSDSVSPVATQIRLVVGTADRTLAFPNIPIGPTPGILYDYGTVLEVFNQGPFSVIWTEAQGVRNLGAATLAQAAGETTEWRFMQAGYDAGVLWFDQWALVNKTGGVATETMVNVSEFGAVGDFHPPVHNVLATVSSNTFVSLVPHLLVAGESVTLGGISTVTGVTNGTTYTVSATGLTANNFTLTGITLGGLDDQITVNSLPTNTHNAANHTANNTAFAAAWAVAQAEQKLLYIPPGEYAIDPGILVTHGRDAGIVGENFVSRLWIIDPAGTGTGITHSMTSSTTFWGVPALFGGRPITGIVVAGTFAGAGSVGVRIGPAIQGYFDVCVTGFSGTGGANGVTGLTGGIGILFQNDYLDDVKVVTGSISGTTLTTTGLTAFDKGRHVFGAGVTALTVITAVINSTTATVGVSSPATGTITLTLGNVRWSEENTFGPNCQVGGCTNGFVVDRGVHGAASFGYNNWEHLFLGVGANQVGFHVTNGADLYACSLVMKGNMSPGPSTAFLLDGGTDNTVNATRLVGHVEITMECNGSTGGALFTTIQTDANAIWNTEGLIDFMTFSDTLSAGNTNASIGTAAFFHDGTLLLAGSPEVQGWKASNNWNYSILSSATQISMPGDVTAVFVPGTDLRWAESGAAKRNVVLSTTLSGGNTVVTVDTAALRDNSSPVGANADPGSMTFMPHNPNIPRLDVAASDTVNVLVRNSRTLSLRAYGTSPQTVLQRVKGSKATPLVASAGDVLGRYSFASVTDATVPTLYVGGSVQALATETWAGAPPTAGGTKLQLWVTPNTTAVLTPAWTVDQDGTTISTNVGGGVPTSYLLKDNSTAVLVNIALGSLTFVGAADGTHTVAYNGAAIYAFADENFATSGTHSGTRLVFATSLNGSGGALTNRAGIDNAGVFFVGTSTARVFTVDQTGNVVTNNITTSSGNYLSTNGNITSTNGSLSVGGTITAGAGASFTVGALGAIVGTSSLTIGSAAQFVVSSSGSITASASIVTTGTLAVTGLITATAGISNAAFSIGSGGAASFASVASTLTATVGSTFSVGLATTLYTTAATKTASYDLLDVANGTALLNNTSGITTLGVYLAPTISWHVATGGGTIAWAGFCDVSTQQNDTAGGGNAKVAGSYHSFYAAPTFGTLDATTQTFTLIEMFKALPSISAFSGSTLNITTLRQFVAAPFTIPTGATITTLNQIQVQGTTVTGTLTTRRGVFINDVASGTPTTNVGLDIDALTGTTAIGIRNADRTVFTPSTVQALLAATQITVNATVIHISSTASRVLTATPTLTAGIQGQIVVIVCDNTTAGRTITFGSNSNTAGSNLSLGAATRVLGTGGSLTLEYSTDLTRWVEIGFNGGTFN